MKRFAYIITLFFLLSPALLATESANTFIIKTVEEISAFITENKAMLENDEAYLRTKVDELVIPKLNISLMSKIVLGRDNWTSSNDYQKREFQKAFRSLMVRTYMKSLITFDGEKMKLCTPGTETIENKVDIKINVNFGCFLIQLILKLLFNYKITTKI